MAHLFEIALLWARCEHIRHSDVCPDDVFVRLLCAATDDLDRLQSLQWVCEHPRIHLTGTLRIVHAVCYGNRTRHTKRAS